MATKYGGKVLFGMGVLVPSILTMFTPSAARIHVYLLVALRILEGLFQVRRVLFAFVTWMLLKDPLGETFLFIAYGPADRKYSKSEK